MVGVALGTLIPTVLVGWLLVLPMALRYLDLGVMDYSKFILSAAAPADTLCALFGGHRLFPPYSRRGRLYRTRYARRLVCGTCFFMDLGQS